MQSPARLAMAFLAAMLAAVAVLGASLLGLHRPEAEGQATTTLAVDADPAGNFAASVGQIDDCVVLDLDETADIDIVLQNVSDVLGFEIQLEYDPTIVEILDSDLKLFLASTSGSRVIDVSEPLPDPDGLYLFGAADIGTDSLDSGSGVLARVTLTAKGEGVSPLSIEGTDIDDDGRPDLLRPRIIGAGGAFIGDQNGDQFFDEQPPGAQVAVDTACPPPASPPTPPLSPEVPPTPTPTPTPTPPGSPTPQGSTPEVGSTPAGDEAVLLFPPVPPAISDSVAPGGQLASGSATGAGSDGTTETTDEGPSDSTSADGDDGSENVDSTSGDRDDGSSSSSSGSGSSLRLVVIIAASVILASGGFVIVRALLARR